MPANHPIFPDTMTMTQAMPAIALTTIEDEGSVVALTLSWPSESKSRERVAGSGRGMHIIELIGDIDIQLAMRARDILTSVAGQGANFTVHVSHVRFIDAGGAGWACSQPCTCALRSRVVS